MHGEELWIEICGRPVPAKHTHLGIRAVKGAATIDPEGVEQYLEQKFGENLGPARSAMQRLAKSYRRAAFAAAAYSLYERFRPAIPEGKKGWGAKGELDIGLNPAAGEENSSPGEMTHGNGRFRPQTELRGREVFPSQRLVLAADPCSDLRLCCDLLGEETVVAIGYNGGAGPEDQATCLEMANRFERWMEHHVTGHGLESEIQVPKRAAWSATRRGRDPDLQTVSAYQTDDDHLKEWIEFLRHCGGFEVW